LQHTEKSAEQMHDYTTYPNVEKDAAAITTGKQNSSSLKRTNGSVEDSQSGQTMWRELQ
jgi:hypothetical protein